MSYYENKAHKFRSKIAFFRFDRYQAECVVPWVNDVLLLLTVSLQTAQQLRDKLDIFKQYKQEIRLSKQ